MVCCGAWAAPAADGAAGRVASASEKGSTMSSEAPNTSSVSCQPMVSISPRVSGGNRNWPNEPAAVARPKPSDFHSLGSSLPNAASTRLNEAAERPKPMSTPADRCSRPGVVA